MNPLISMRLNSGPRLFPKFTCPFLVGVTAAVLLAGLATSFAAGLSPVQEQVNQLVSVLKSGAPQKEKADACRELARVGTKDAVAPLAALLADDNLSHMARYGLETIPDPSVDKAFRDALAKLRGRNLVGVLGSIGVRQDTKAVKPLAKLLRDSDSEVAQAAARALGKIGNASAAQALEAALLEVSADNRLAFCEGLLRCAETLADDGERKPAMAIYDRIRTLQVPQQVRTAALRGAILTRQDKGLPLLLETLRSDDFALFVAAARISAEMPGPDVTRALATELPKVSADKQILLIQTLAKRADPAALPALFEAAKKSDKPVRLAALRAIAELGYPASVPVLVALLGDPDREISQTAQEALASLPGKEADTAVLTMFISPTIGRRLTGMELAARRRMSSAIPDLVAATSDIEPKIRIPALRTLADLGGPAQIPGLLLLLERPRSPEDMEATEQALTVLSAKAPKPDVCAAELASWLPKLRPPQQCALLRVLTTIGGTKALETVRAAITNPDLDVHGAAVRALSGWNTPDAAPFLLELLRKGAAPSDAALYLRGYLRLAGQPDLAPEKRLTMCRDITEFVQSGDEKKLLLGALSSIQSLESLELIQPYLENSICKEEACAACVSISDKLLQGSDSAKVAPKLIELLDKVAQTTANADLAKRAQTLAEQARNKANK